MTPAGRRRRIAWFALVGALATLIYLVGAMLGAALGAPAAISSFSAYGAAALFSYLGHRFLSFESRAPHTTTAPRFALVTLLQLALSFALPAGAVALGFGAFAGFALVCVAAPLVGFVAMRGWVFKEARAGAAAP